MNPYAGGDVVFNSTPFTQYYLQKLQQKQAKRDALDQYYSNLTRSVNTQGVRHIDIQGGLANKISDWRSFAMQNRDKLLDPRKDHYQTLNEFQSRYQDILNDTEQSKAAAANEMEAGKRFFDLNKEGIATDEDMNTIIPAHQASIYDTKHYKQDGVTPYTANDLSFLAKMPTQQELSAFITNATKGAKPTTLSVTEQNIPDAKMKYQGMRRKTETVGYAPETLKGIGDAAAGLVNNPSFNRWSNELFHSPADMERYNEGFKNIYGRDIQNNKDLAAAYVIHSIGAPQQKVTDTPYTDQYGMQTSLLGMRNAHDEAMLAKRIAAKKGDAQAQNEKLDEVIERIKTNAAPNAVNYTPAQGASEKQFIIPKPTNDMMEILKNGNDNPNQIRLSEDGKYVIGIFYKGKKVQEGNKMVFKLDDPTKDGKIAVDKNLTTRIPIDEFKLLYGKKLMGQKNAVAETEDDGATGASSRNTDRTNEVNETIDLGNNN